MNLATPILICHHNEDFRALLRDMLTKHGFFHVLETTSQQELVEHLKKESKSPFLLLEEALLDEEIVSKLIRSNDFLIISRPYNEKTFSLATRLGIKHFLSFPFSSQKLFERISAVVQ